MPSPNPDQPPLISTAIDYYKEELKDANETDKMFKNHTKYPHKAILKEESRVMFLNNKYFSKGIYNGSIGVIMKILNESLIEVSFPVSNGIIRERYCILHSKWSSSKTHYRIHLHSQFIRHKA